MLLIVTRRRSSTWIWVQPTSRSSPHSMMTSGKNSGRSGKVSATMSLREATIVGQMQIRTQAMTRTPLLGMLTILLSYCQNSRAVYLPLGISTTRIIAWWARKAASIGFSAAWAMNRQRTFIESIGRLYRPLRFIQQREFLVSAGFPMSWQWALETIMSLSSPGHPISMCIELEGGIQTVW